MYECLYGFTPFACEDRHQTKLKILQHKKTLAFPESEVNPVPSIEAMDLMMQLLVEKEKRLCSRQYELNDFTRKIVRGRVVRCVADKTHQNYQGYFVYSEDAEDIKRHAFFRDIDWDTIHLRRPPFVPRVRDWEDTKYFDEEEPVSDINTATTLDEEVIRRDDENQKTRGLSKDLSPPPAATTSSQVSHHQQEDQNIVPSTALKVPQQADGPNPEIFLRAEDSMNDMRNPLLAPQNPAVPSKLCVPSPGSPVADNGFQVDGPTERVSVPVIKAPPKRKEKKRPRDVILRDPVTGPEALEIRKASAFLGYDYRQPRTVQDIIEQVIAEELTSSRAKDNRYGLDQDDPDLSSEKRMFVEAGGHLSSPRRVGGLL